MEVVDKGIAESCSTDGALRLINIGLLCVQHDPLERPSMSQVVLFLSSKSTSLPAVSSLQGFTETSASIGNPLEHNVPSPMRNGGFFTATENTTSEPG